MEILNDILKQQDKQTTEIQQLTKEIQQLKIGANKPINLDFSKVVSEITQHLDLRANEIVKATEELNRVVHKIPSAIHNTWGINTSTKSWFAGLLVAFGIGWYFAPSAISAGQEYYKRQLEIREQQIELFATKNPETARKYFKR